MQAHKMFTSPTANAVESIGATNFPFSSRVGRCPRPPRGKRPADRQRGRLGRQDRDRRGLDCSVSKAPPSFINDPDHWCQRAEEARTLAAQIRDAQARVAMLRIADDYERLAKRAEARAIGRDPNSN